MTDRRFLTLFSIGLVFLTTLPFLLGFFLAPPGETYTGIHKLTPGDFPVYYSYIEQARGGHVLFLDLFTSEPQTRILFFPFWLIPGFLGRLLPFLSAPVLFQIARIALVPFFLVATVAFLRRLFDRAQTRRNLLFFVVFASGLGALITPAIVDRLSVDLVRGIIEWPMDLWVPEAITFLTLLNAPHVLAAELLLLSVVLSTIRAAEGRRPRSAVAAGLCASGALLIHPFLIYPLIGFFVVLAFVRLLRRQSVRPLLPPGLAVLLGILPVAAYDLWLANDPLFHARQLQNVLRFPSLDLTLASYGLLLPLALFGLVKLARRIDEWPVACLFAWFFGQGITLFVPFDFVRRLTEGFHIPLAILAGFGFLALLSHLRTEPFRWVVGGILAAILVTSNALTYVTDLSLFLDRPPVVDRSPLSHRRAAVMEAFRWLAKHSEPGAVILTDVLNGNFLPAYAVRTTYLGHGVETIQYQAKRNRLEWYLHGDGSVEERSTFLRDARITYVLETPELRAAKRINLDAEPSLELVWRFGPEATLYRVTADN